MKRFMKALAENLYFKNLDNNAGVLHHLIDAAEEEEFKEALLAYLFLAATPEGLTRHRLDKVVEDWLASGWDCRIDFEVDDALDKRRVGGCCAAMAIACGCWRPPTPKPSSIASGMTFLNMPRQHNVRGGFNPA